MLPPLFLVRQQGLQVKKKEKEKRMQFQAAESWGGVFNDEQASRPLELVEQLAVERPVVIFSLNTCCMCHAVKWLFCGMGVSPTMYKLDEHPMARRWREPSLASSMLGPWLSPWSSSMASLWLPWTGLWPPTSMAPLSPSSKGPVLSGSKKMISEQFL